MKRVFLSFLVLFLSPAFAENGDKAFRQIDRACGKEASAILKSYLLPNRIPTVTAYCSPSFYCEDAKRQSLRMNEESLAEQTAQALKSAINKKGKLTDEAQRAVWAACLSEIGQFIAEAHSRNMLTGVYFELVASRFQRIEMKLVLNQN